MYDQNDPHTIRNDHPVSGLPVDTALLFSDEKHTGNEKTAKKRAKLLAKASFLTAFLDPDEKVVFVTTGCSPFGKRELRAHAVSFVMTAKRSLLVFTDKRIFHILTTPKYEYRGSIAQMFYADCRRLYVKGTTLFVEYRTGKKEQFRCIPKGDGAVIGRITEGVPEAAVPSDVPERNHLCPSCTHVLRPDTVTCPGCGLEFKSKAKALRYAILLPGGGYFYLRRWDTAIGHVVVELFFGFMAVMDFRLVVLGHLWLLLAFIMYVGLLVYLRRCAVYGAEHMVAEFIPVDRKSLLAGRNGPVEQPPVCRPTDRRQTVEEILSAGRKRES